MLQQEAYLLFYIRDKDYKPPNTPFPPGSSTHFKVDPNFLSSSNKQFSRVGLDKTGTPLVRIKPTGVVQPSPQKETPTASKLPLPSKGQSSSPPVPTSGELVTPKSKSMSPNSSGGSGNGMTSPMMRDFSIPLRKISSTATPSRHVADKTEATRTNALRQPPTSVPQQQATPIAAASLRFTPRQISAPPSKTKKQQKIAVVTSAMLNQEVEKTAATGDKEVTSDVVHEVSIQTAPSIASQSTSDRKDDDSTTVDSKSKAEPGFKAIQSEESTAQGRFIGPRLPSSPSSSLPQSPLRVPSFSLKPSTTSPVSSKAVAMVPPQPQAREKPVARVRPNPHVQEDEETTPRKMASSKEGGSLPSTPGPHMNAVTPWKVRESTSGEAFGPALPEGLEYNSSAHGWNVSAIASGEEGKGEEQVTPHGKAKKHKKKKKHRKREEDESNESEGERGGGKREKSKKESSSKKMKSRDVSYSPEWGRRRYSHSPDKGHHHRHSPERTPHYDRYRKYRKHSYRDRDRDTSEHPTHRRYKYKGSRYSHHDRSRSHSRSRSRSPLNPDSEDRYHHYHRERNRTSPLRHVHQHHHHTPFLDMGEGGGGHWKSHHHSPYHRVKHCSDSSERRVNIKSDEARRRDRKRGHHHDTMSEDENDHKKHKRSAQSGKKKKKNCLALAILILFCCFFISKLNFLYDYF